MPWIALPQIRVHLFLPSLLEVFYLSHNSHLRISFRTPITRTMPSSSQRPVTSKSRTMPAPASGGVTTHHRSGSVSKQSSSRPAQSRSQTLPNVTSSPRVSSSSRSPAQSHSRHNSTSHNSSRSAQREREYQLFFSCTRNAYIPNAVIIYLPRTAEASPHRSSGSGSRERSSSSAHRHHEHSRSGHSHSHSHGVPIQTANGRQIVYVRCDKKHVEDGFIGRCQKVLRQYVKWD